MELQSTEIESLKTLLQRKRSERRLQVNILVELLYQLRYLMGKVEDKKEHNYLLRVQRDEEDKNSREQILLERRQILEENEKQEKETELCKWQLDQVEKQKGRPKVNERPILHYSKINPWTVKENLMRDHSEQISSWHLRFIFLQRTKPSITMKEIQSGEVSLRTLRPWILRHAQKYEEDFCKMQLEMQHIIQQQRQETLQLERDTVKYMKAFWNTKTTTIRKTIRESEITQQLTTFNEKVGSHITSLYHRII